jgi:4-hydroxy-4-methyl-2-oxoglutarate aldolase
MATPTLEELCNGFQQTYVAAVADILDFQFDLHDQWLGPEIKPLVPEMRVAGPAFTLRWVNDRTPGGERLGRLAAGIIDGLRPLMVVVADTSKSRNAGYWGELMCNISLERGVHGAVIDGGVRDPYYIWKAGFNMFCAFTCPNEADTRSRLDSFQEPIAINNVQIRPGDFIVADFGGVVVVPQEIVPAVYQRVQELVAKESSFRKMIREGISGADAVRVFGKSI